MKVPTVLSTFSGVGGLDLGLEHAGFEVAGCIEFDEVARRSLKANRPSWHLFQPGDIQLLAPDLWPERLGLKTGELTLLAGAPPCQPYSKAAMWAAGSWSGFADSRAKPLLSFMELAERFQPRAVLMENVQGFITGKNSVLPLIEDLFDQINGRTGCRYRVEASLIDASDVGVPQRRRRAIVVALRDGVEMVWPEATHRENPTRAWDALAELTPESALPVAGGKWADLLPSVPEGQNYLWHTPRGGGDSLFGYRTKYWSFLLKLAKDKPSWTLPAQPGPSVGPFHWDNRPLSTVEMLRLQSFPASWIVEGTRREQTRQVGNATPPLLGEVLGRALRGVLDGVVWDAPPGLAIERQASVPAAKRPRPVPRAYHDLRGSYADHPGTGEGPSPRVG